MVAAKQAGFQVSVATRVRKHGSVIRDAGIELIPLNWRRGDIGLLSTVRDMLRVYKLYRCERPDIVHHIAVKPAVLGGLAALLAGVPATVTTLAGRGTALLGNGPIARLAGRVLMFLLALLERRSMTVVIVQNEDDRKWLSRSGAIRHIELIRGSGVDLDRFRPLPEPTGPFTVAQVSRMLTIKGVATVVEAVSRLRADGVDIQLLLAGDIDADSRAAIPLRQLLDWTQRPGIVWLGQVGDVRDLWSRAHVAVLGSLGGEGVPKSLIEAAACGRPIVATDVPGNREIARTGMNALLVPPGDAVAMAEALQRLSDDANLRRQLGAGGRAFVDPEFGDLHVAERTIQLYRRVLR